MSRPTARRTASTNLGGQGVEFGSLNGRLAIVTGASRGIGAAICRNLASKGCSLIMNYTSDKSSESIQAFATDLENEFSVRTFVVQADMGSERGPAYIIDMAKNKFQHPRSGRFQVDILVQNAGVSGNAPVDKITLDDFAQQYNVNVRGPLLLLQAALPYLPHDRSGRIVNVSSVSSSLGLQAQTVYGGTKAALEAMTRTWARELADRCTVNAVNPGPVDTDMYGNTEDWFRDHLANFIRHAPLMAAREGVDSQEKVENAKTSGGRPAYPYEVAGIVAMLCTGDAGWCTGSVVCANGGMTMLQ